MMEIDGLRVSRRQLLKGVAGLTAAGTLAGPFTSSTSVAGATAPRGLPPVGSFPGFEYPLPASASEWDAGRADLRRSLTQILRMPPLKRGPVKLSGELDPRPIFKRVRDWWPAKNAGEYPALMSPPFGYRVHRFTFDNRMGASGLPRALGGPIVSGFLMIPDGVDDDHPAPAILHNHYHGGEHVLGKDELFSPWPDREPPGVAFVRRGFVVACIDQYTFGERNADGGLPGGSNARGYELEYRLATTMLLQGRTLWGAMVRDNILALDWLADLPFVDERRIGTHGMSMGCVQSVWTAALSDKISTVVSVAGHVRYQDLIRVGHNESHGIYFYVPEMLAAGVDLEAVLGLIAPRPHLMITGEDDYLVPLEGFKRASRWNEDLYAMYGANGSLVSLIRRNKGHHYGRKQFRRAVRWLSETMPSH